MKKVTIGIVSYVAVLLPCLAATETVDGITWTYTVSNGAASVTLSMPTGLPTVSTSDNGKILKVVNGVWAASN